MSKVRKPCCEERCEDTSRGHPQNALLSEPTCVFDEPHDLQDVENDDLGQLAATSGQLPAET
tara:strand:+ start:293 stop:478 length:186 start_codon:yes stop_codon:yes gene_type:complete